MFGSPPAAVAIPASAEYVNEGWDDSDAGGWTAITNDQFFEIIDTGGVGGGGWLHTYQLTEMHGISGALQRHAPYIGNFSDRGYIVVRCSLQYFAHPFILQVLHAEGQGIYFYAGGHQVGLGFHGKNIGIAAWAAPSPY